MRIEYILNSACKALYKGEYKRFSAPCDVEKVQSEYLLRLLAENSDTVYGREHGFDNIHSYDDFARIVPLTVYEDYEPYIGRIGKGEKRVLTAEDVTLFELTSGSSGGKKLIPYTKTLKDEFQRGIKPWLYNIYDKTEGVTDGKSYWSITPVTAGKKYTECGIPIGFEEDADYFGAVGKALMKRLFAVDGTVKFSKDTDDFYFRTAEQLLRCKHLTLISVWNPTLLTILCGFIRKNADSFQLAEERKSAVLRGDFELVFPELRIVSCWADGSAAPQINEVRKYFPNVYIQPKGLLATECFTSFPLVGETGGRLSVYSHFFEFKCLSDGRIYPAWELKKGEYEIIVTTGGGFYRYRIGDIIEVLETFTDRPPLIRFLRRRGITSDLFGEKLTEEFVRGICEKLGVADKFCLLAPSTLAPSTLASKSNKYVLYTEAEGIDGEQLDSALREGYHYDYCRSLGQLERAEVRKISGDPRKAYTDRLAADGMKIGDIKPAFLSRKADWEKWFKGE